MKQILLSSILLKSVWERKKSFFFWFVGLIAYALLIIGLYPSFGEQDAYSELVENLPPALDALFGQLSTIGTPEGYLSLEHMAVVFPIFVTIAIVSLASSLITSEESSGTLELLLSRPISRTAIVLQKVILVYLMALWVGFANWVGLAIGPLIVDVSFNEINVLWASISVSLLAIVFGSFALMLTSIKNSRGIAIAVSMSLFMLSYLLNSFSKLIDWLEPYKELSVFHYYDAYEIMLNGPNPNHLILLFMIGILFVPFSLYFFNRRDTGV